MNFYGISKFTAKITKESLEILFICVYGYSNNPVGFCFFQPEVPGPGQRGSAGFDRPFPGEGITGGEGGGVWELHGFKAHLRVVLGCGEGLGGGGSTEQGGGGGSSTAARVLR